MSSEAVTPTPRRAGPLAVASSSPRRGVVLLVFALFFYISLVTNILAPLIPAIISGISNSIGFLAKRVPNTVLVEHFSR